MIIVTGAAGFIGSCVVSKLNERGITNLLVVDEIEFDEQNQNLKQYSYQEFQDKATFIDLVKTDKLKGDIEAIIHMGACSSTTLNDADYFEENNYEYTRLCAEWSVNHGVRFIYASSAATYGNGSLGYKDSEEMVQSCEPLNLYGQSKAKFDRWALDQGYLEKIVGLKFFNVFGPNEYHKKDMRSIIAKTYQRVI